MKVFVTGALGFIGMHFVRELVRIASVRCLVLKETSKDPRRLDAEQRNIALLKSLGCEVCFGDITLGHERLVDLMQDATHVLHLAGLYSFNAPSKLLYDVNVVGAYNVARAALEMNIPMVHFSTVATMGRQQGVFDESAQRGDQICAYGESKARGDNLIRDMRDSMGLKVTIVYPGPVLGSGDNNASAKYIWAVTRPNLPFGTGMLGQTYAKSVHTWLHVHDAVDAGISALKKESAIGHEYLVGGHMLTFREFNGLIANIWKNRKYLRRPWLKQAWAVTALAHVFDLFARAFGCEPWWGLSVDADRVMRTGFAFSGSKAQAELLESRPYRSVESALVDFKNKRCSECDCSK